MKKFIKNKNMLIGIIILAILLPIMTTLLVTKSSPLENFTTDNDWIGFFGSYTGAIIGGFITFLVLDETIKNGDANLEKSIDSNKKLDLCSEVSNAVAKYCTIARQKRHLNSQMNIIIEHSNELECELNKTKEGSKKYNDLSKENMEILSELHRKLSEFNMMDTTTPKFLLTIKLVHIQEAGAILRKIDTINNLICNKKISNEEFETHINTLLIETSKFINQYL